MEEDKTVPPEQIEVMTDQIEQHTVENIMEDNYLRYSMSVIVSRALPDVRDGLKPVHRRILYTMLEEGLRSNAKYRKSANVTGTVMARYHPHGNAAIYDAMARMAQPWSLRYQMVDGQGNFGSMDGDPPAAERYTEARMAKFSEAMLADIEKNTVPFVPNYDGERMQPEVLPAAVPNLLLNGQVGIAVGMATSIPTHNLGEVVDATIHLIDNPDADVEALLKFIKGPDFPTGGIVFGGEGLRQAYATGRGGVVVRGVANIEERGKGLFRIVITEVPFGINKSNMLGKMAELVRDKKITGVSDIRDESARGTVRVVVDIKKDGYPKKILNQLYKFTPLQTSFHYNMLALIDGVQPRVLGVIEILKEFVKHRQVVIRRRTEFELQKAKDRAHILEGLKLALDHIDEVINTIRSSDTADEALTKLMAQFSLSEIQARAILAMPLRQLAGLERKKIEDELAELQALINRLTELLGDENKILAVVKDELLEAKKSFGDERRTQIIAGDLGKISEEELIPDEDIVITITTANYIKRSPAGEYKRQGRGGKGRRGMTTRDEDNIEHLVFARTHDFLLFFTDRGRVFRMKAHEVPASSLNAKGVAIVNLLQLQPDEQVRAVIRVNKAEEAGNLFMCTVNGVVKKTPYEQYRNVRGSGIIAIKLDQGDELRWIRFTSGDNEVVITTAAGQAMRFHEKDVRPMGRNSRGVRGIRLRADDQVVGMDVVREGVQLFVISEKGYGKRTKVEQFTEHKRGGVGIRAAVVNDKTGRLVSVTSIDETAKEVIMISSQGQTIRLRIKDIPQIGRATQGVRIMRLKDSDKVASVALVGESEELEEEAEQS